MILTNRTAVLKHLTHPARLHLLRIFLVSLIVLLDACSPVPGNTEFTPTLSQEATATPMPTEQATITPPLIAEPVCQGDECIQPTPTELPPLQLVLPTPGSEPASAWRPPLYPVPWAVSPEDHFYFIRPIAADTVNWPEADYRYGGIFFGSDIIHTGIDISSKHGTPVIASGPGMVVWAGWGLYSGASGNQKDPYGQAVVIRHDFGHNGTTLYTVYAHLSQIDVSRGQWVDTAQQIGLVGETGLTTGPHLHFEVRVGENDFFTTRNPELWLVPPQGWGILVGRIATRGDWPMKNQLVVVQSQETGQRWRVRTYGNLSIKSDEYYNENLVLSDLPAGKYIIWMPEYSSTLTNEIEIFPGQISYFTLRGYRDFSTERPALATPENLPPQE